MLKKIASNTISQILSKVFTAIISIFLISALTKYLSPEMYGQYNKIYNYLAIFTFLADLGLYTISVREISKDRENAHKIVGNVMSLRFILAIAIIFLSVLIALFLPGYNSNITLISIFIISIFSVFSLMNSSVLSLMQAFMKIEFSGVTFVIGKIVNLSIILFIIYFIYPKNTTTSFDNSFILIMISGLIGIIVNYYMNYFYAKKIVEIKFLFDIDYMKHLFKISLPYGVALFLSIVYFKVDVVIISLLEPQVKADLSIAFYSLPMKIIEVLMVIGVFFLNSILPSLSELFKENNLEKITILLKNSFRFLFSFSLIIVVLGILFGKDIISIIATKDYLDSTIHNYTSYDAMIVVLFVLLFYFISSLFNYIFIASKNEKTILHINIIITIVNIVGNILLIPKFSFIGSALTTLFSQILLFGLSYYFSRKIIKFDFDFFYLLKAIIFSIFMFLLGNYFLLNYNLGHIGNILIYGTIFFIIFIGYFLLLNKSIISGQLKLKN
ncbi:MAG: oligosaccharide flippase family protein [Candidatus Gracilibacteria bacterium]|nr:oligosaccharide flippase family protein [Candidatus Gracilibacteria bacterium]